MAMTNVPIKTRAPDEVCQTGDAIQGTYAVEAHESVRQR